MELPKSYFACVLHRPGDDWSLQEVELKPPQPGEILIKIRCCGFCHTDLSTQAGHLGSMVQWPTTPGHEIVGDVVAIGDNVKQWKIGDRVGGSWHGGHDLTCRPCTEGHFQGCEKQVINGIHKPGGFAEYCTLRSEAVVALPKDLNPVDAAPLLCAGVTMFTSMRHQNVRPGETVAIQGLGGLGHLGVQYAAKMGYSVVVISGDASKENDAFALGAHHFIDAKAKDAACELKKLGGAQLIVITAPNPNIIGQYTDCLKWGGKLLVLAPVDGVVLNAAHLIHNSCSVGGWHAGSALDCQYTVEFSQLTGIKPMVDVFPFSQVKEAANLVASGKCRYRVVLTMD
ncbi:hypothetical protein NLG97_g333 [Lecanicillium saksenae]|uniref:Uncharacterized protein n=1 Tax=Lecanicillium saksenae TaxID=468837 RepID=A0ACC1R6U2_9HYPO|nr:hypothetical protein NLG97_g333 [Lecanicillium saksenae]